MIWEPPEIKSDTVSTVSPSILSSMPLNFFLHLCQLFEVKFDNDSEYLQGSLCISTVLGTLHGLT